MSEKGKNNKKKTGLGLAIWILLILIVLIIFLVKQEEIKENINKSGASELIEKKIGKDIFNSKDSNTKVAKDDDVETIIDLKVNSRKNQDEKQDKADEKEKVEKTTEVKKDTPVKENKSEAKKTEEKTTAKEDNSIKKSQSATKSDEKKTADKNKQNQVAVQKEEKKESQKETKKETITQESNTLKKKICFVAIDSDGPVVRKLVTRSVSKDSPMGDALNMLLAGPSSSEEKTGCRSLIPSGTRLLSASVKNGVAILNFSEEFQFNQFGAEGSLAQLMQVVYTSTEFSTVKSVQILIEGQKRDYLTEGVWIGSPLTRSSF